MEQAKTEVLKVRVTPLDRARMDSEAKIAGTDLSTWIRVKLGIETIGKISGENSKITITQVDGEVMTIREELQRR